MFAWLALFLIQFFQIFLVCTSALAFHVVIDPGHGGSDRGATRGDFVEANLVLNISKKLQRELENKYRIRVTLTRDRDISLPLKSRTEIANTLKADLYLSLHANTSNSKNLTGMEFYFNSSNSAIVASSTPDVNSVVDVIEAIKEDFAFYEKTKKSLMLTKTINQLSSISAEKSVIKRAPFFVVENTKMPAVLLELGFLSNRRDAKRLADPSYQDSVAIFIAKAISDYKEMSDKIK